MVSARIAFSSFRLHLALALAALLSSVALARPAVMQEAAKLTLPEPNYQIIDLALDGNDLLVLAFLEGGQQYTLFHFERQSASSWLSRGAVAFGIFDGVYYNAWLELKNGVGLFATAQERPLILERTASGFRTVPAPVMTISDVAIHGQTIAVGTQTNVRSMVHLLAKNTQGQWTSSTTLQAAPGYFDDGFLGPDVELGKSEITAGNYYESFDDAGYLTYVFDRVENRWQVASTVDSVFPTTLIEERIARRGSSWYEPGDIATSFTRTTGGSWSARHSLLTDEWFADRRSGGLAFAGALAYSAAPHDDSRGHNAGSITVLTRTDPIRFTHVATLVASDPSVDARLGAALSVSGPRVAASGPPRHVRTGAFNDDIYIFELPTRLPSVARHQDTFEDMNASGWTPWGATRWRVVASGGSQVFRQTNTHGDARAIFDGFEGTHQSIQSDLKVNAGNGTKHWAGLMVRYRDPANFYYLMNGRNNTIELRKNVNGVFGPIASAPFTMQIGRTYRFRLEAIGQLIRGYVDDRLVLEARDSSLSRGRVGLAMWKADAQYDNIIVSSNPQTTLHSDTFAATEDENATPPWHMAPANAWSRTKTSSGATIFRQSNTTGNARAVHGAPTEDQIITADLRLSASASGWAGLMARYVDDLSYYYVFLKDSEDKISLRRWLDGKITTLDEASMTVTPGALYRLRFEAIGTSLRVYVNGKPLLEGEDAAIPMGEYGLVTYRSAAQFDSFKVVRP